MILALDTSTPVCRISVFVDDVWHDHEWDAGRGLAKGLLGNLQEVLSEYRETLSTVSGLIAFQGPGSYTGLRIGLTVLNTIASAQHIPIVGATGDDWRDDGLARIKSGADDQLVMPEYGGEPHITTPRK